MKKKRNKSTFFEHHEEHFEIIQRLNQLGSWRLDLESETISPSPEACRIYGLDYGDYSLKLIQSLPLPEYRTKLDGELKKLIENGGGYNIEYQIKRADDGEVRDIHSLAEYDAEQHIITGAIHDITDRKTAERKLQESEARYRNLFDNSVSGIIYTDTDGNILEVNSKMLQMLGSPSLEATKKVNVLTFPLLVETGFSADFKQVLDTSSVVHRSTRYRSKWGAEHFLEYVLSPVMRGDELIRIIGKVEDITDRKLAEEKVQSLLKEKDILLREIHHRLKNNMTSIEGLLKIQLSSSDDPRSNAAIVDAVARLSSMRVLYDKLYLSSDFIYVSIEDYLSTLTDEIFHVFPGSKDVEIVKNLQNFRIPSDKIFPLGLMINELLTNAFKYAFSDSGREKRIEISAAVRDNKVKIIMKDSGPGYPQPGGESGTSGFGLQLVWMLSKQIGGTAEFKNEDGAVCEIEFDLD